MAAQPLCLNEEELAVTDPTYDLGAMALAGRSTTPIARRQATPRPSRGMANCGGPRLADSASAYLLIPQPVRIYVEY